MYNIFNEFFADESVLEDSIKASQSPSLPRTERRKFSWTTLQVDRLQAVRKVIYDLKEYWPLTIRQIHYQLFARKIFWGGRRESKTYPNTGSGQNDLIRIAKHGRIGGYIPWNSIEDRTRTLFRPYKFEDVQSYIKNELRYLLTDYQRCLVQDQNVYVEVWVEKDALFRIFKDVTKEYCVPCVACKGYDSITYLHSFYKMASKAIEQGRKPVVLYFGDLDPSGVAMLESSIETLEKEMGLSGAVFKRIAVNPLQVGAFELPNDPKSGKTKDPRFKDYVRVYGHTFVELDAFHPKQIEDMVRAAIEDEFDMDSFRMQEEIGASDQERIDRIRKRVVDVFNDELGTSFSI